jgi:hypothetical protein
MPARWRPTANCWNACQKLKISIQKARNEKNCNKFAICFYVYVHVCICCACLSNQDDIKVKLIDNTTYILITTTQISNILDKHRIVALFLSLPMLRKCDNK